ncbi:hypothetical protein [Kitasatospora kifunensis]|uniref:Uncharacterized protein n=1 Tax=Kitasatospora kifunensis TaxID=58351 RepID=A0A7W7QYM1_KITKI|nr:hypothetical protein [Kitasatospora kifunensis]MBB4922217.1 hypothetical protein [Kitasatospora kifunensis]
MSWHYEPDFKLFTRHAAPHIPGPTTAYGILNLTNTQLRRKIAIHEAGHAVLMLDREIAFVTVQIADDLGHGPGKESPAGHVELHSSLTAPLPDALLGLAAGERAEDRWLREQGLWTSARAWVVEILASNDRQQIARVSWEAHGRPVTYGVSDDPRRDLAAMHDVADEALDDLWGHVLDVAEALDRHGRLDYAQAAAAAGYAPCGH